MTLTAMVLLAAIPSAHAQQPAARRGADLLVSTEWLAVHVSDPGISVLHVGADRKSYEAGHIPGARFVALSQLVVTRDDVPNELPPAADLVARFSALGIGDAGRVILYGDEKGLLAARAFFTLDYLGHGDRAALLDGGLEKWRAEGRAVTSAEPPVSPRSFTPALRPDVLASLTFVRDVSWLLSSGANAPWALVDARPEAQFAGTEPGPAIQRPGHIPGAVSLFWQRALVSPDNPVVRPEAELRQMFDRAGAAAPPQTVITYCRTGVQASFAYFVARYLGLAVRMYDGSFIEWSRNADLPVAPAKP